MSPADGPSRPDAPAPRAPSSARGGLPPRAGIGFKPVHFDALVADPAPPAFVEVHAENHLGAGGRPHAQLRELVARMPVSVHGVGLSIGGESLDDAHLARIAGLIAQHPAAAFSEHLAWSTHEGRFFNDLLPIRYDRATLDRVCRHVDRVQARLGRPMLLENPSTYVAFDGADFDEAGFLARVVERTGCGLLLDLNNVHVSCHNHGRDRLEYLRALPLEAIGEVHLAGHSVDAAARPVLLIDDHGAPVNEAVWTLYAWLLDVIGPVPTLIEWDTDVPAYAVLRSEARRAQAMLDAVAAQPQVAA